MQITRVVLERAARGVQREGGVFARRVGVCETRLRIASHAFGGGKLGVRRAQGIVRRHARAFVVQAPLQLGQLERRSLCRHPLLREQRACRRQLREARAPCGFARLATEELSVAL